MYLYSRAREVPFGGCTSDEMHGSRAATDVESRSFGEAQGTFFCFQGSRPAPSRTSRRLRLLPMDC